MKKIKKKHNTKVFILLLLIAVIANFYLKKNSRSSDIILTLSELLEIPYSYAEEGDTAIIYPPWNAPQIPPQILPQIPPWILLQNPQTLSFSED